MVAVNVPEFHVQPKFSLYVASSETIRVGLLAKPNWVLVPSTLPDEVLDIVIEPPPPVVIFIWVQKAIFV